MLDQNTREVIPVLVPYVGGESATSLPLQMLSFTGTPGNKSIALGWRTSHEVNSAYFMVEKSSNGISFHDVARVVAKRNPTPVNEYSYTDADKRTADT